MSDSQRLIIDGQVLPFETGDSVLLAALRAAIHPTGGGCLCNAGDCPHCLVTIDGVAYQRACQVIARPGMVVRLEHKEGRPPLSVKPPPEITRHVRHIHCDTVVIGLGQSGQAAYNEAKQAGKNVIALDARQGQEVIGIYAGLLVVARSEEGLLNIHPDEVIVATGSAEIQPVAEGNHLAGILTPGALRDFYQAGLALGKIVVIGEAPKGLELTPINAEVIRFEGESKLEAVLVKDASGKETRHSCDTVCVSVGYQARDVLLRMAEGLDSVHGVGDCAETSDLPPCPKSGLVCSCSGVRVSDLEYTWDHGFQEMELVKRSTLAGTGSCQGSVCLPHLRSFLLEKGGKLQDRFTARPVARQLSIAEVAAGARLQPIPRTSLDRIHRELGAQMDRIGGWWRPWNYGNVLQEYWAVREAVSLADVSTLGKMLVSGPDALAFLEKLYPTQVSSLKTGRSRYVLILDERGYVLDDGLIAKETDERYFLTFTSGGSSFAEAWLRDWASSWQCDVRIMNQTMSLAALNLTGPLAKVLLDRAGLANPPGFMRFTDAKVAGIPCKIFRLSFTGEVSFELHHGAEHSEALWLELMTLGKDLGIKPHGLEALEMLRLEKGHIIVNKDTDFDSTPRRINHEWMIAPEKTGYLGYHALTRTNKIPLNKQLVGLEMASAEAPYEGSILYHQGNYVGYVTSSCYSPVLARTVMLAWLNLHEGKLPTDVTINGQPARRVDLPFYDKEARRAKA